MTALSHSQQEGLKQVVGLMETHNLSVGNVRAAVNANKKGNKEERNRSRGEIILRLFTYLGGTLIFAGLGVFIETIWADIGSLPRVIVTFGSGFTAYLLGMVFTADKRFEKAATPAFIISFLLQPIGLFVFLDEYFSGGEPALGSMLVFGLLTIQQGLTFVKFRRPALLLFTLLYGTGFFISATEYFDIERGISALIIGTFLFFTSVDLQKRTDFKDLTPVFFIISTIFFFSGLYHYIGQTVLDPIGLSVTLTMLAYAVIRDNKTLYVMSVLYMCGYFIGGPGGGWYGGWNQNKEITAVFTGTSLLLTGHWMRQSNYISLYPVWMFLGMAFALGGVYSFVYETAFETLFIAAAAFGIYASLELRSRASLAASILWLIGFITAFTAEHFANTVGWPLLLIFIGFLILGAGFVFARLAGRIKKAVPA
jgi:hypothetical protein